MVGKNQMEYDLANFVMMYKDTFDKQTLLFKETIFVWFWASLRLWMLLLPLVADCIGNAWCFCRLLPLFSSWAFDNWGSMFDWLGSSNIPIDSCWFEVIWSSAVPTNIFRFCCSVNAVECCSIAADLIYCLQVKALKQINKKMIIKKVSR